MSGMVLGCSYVPENSPRWDEQVIADLLCAVRLDHPTRHDWGECDICLALGWGLVRVAAAMTRGSYSTTVTEEIGKDALPSLAEYKRFREIQGAEEAQEGPRQGSVSSG